MPLRINCYLELVPPKDDKKFHAMSTKQVSLCILGVLLEISDEWGQYTEPQFHSPSQQKDRGSIMENNIPSSQSTIGVTSTLKSVEASCN